MQPSNMSMRSLNMEPPFKDLFDLQEKAWSQFSLLNPMGLMRMSNPSEFMEKSMELLVENGHETLDYLHHLFFIWEKHALNMGQDAQKRMEEMMSESERFGQQTMTRSMGSRSSSMRNGSGRSSSKSRSSSKNRKMTSH